MRLKSSVCFAFLCAGSSLFMPAVFADRALDPAALPVANDASPVAGIVEENVPGWIWRDTVTIEDTLFHGGAAVAGGPNCYGSFTFHGTGVEVFAIAGPAVVAEGRAHKPGRIKVLLDGKPQTEISLYRSSDQSDVSVFKATKLSDGNHVLELQAVGGWIAVDYLKIEGPASSSGGDVGGDGGSAGIDFSQGFGSAAGLKFNGFARPYGNGILLTDGQGNEASSMFFTRPVAAKTFTTRFRFQFAKDTLGDGLTFCLQNNRPAALGPWGGEMAYKGIDNSVAVKFDLFDNFGEGKNSTGVYFDGAYPALPAVDLAQSGIDLHAGDPIDVVITYNGKTLKVKETDVVTLATAAQSYQIDIPLYTGPRAYAGFTASMGGAISTLYLNSWTM